MRNSGRMYSAFIVIGGILTRSHCMLGLGKEQRAVRYNNSIQVAGRFQYTRSVYIEVIKDLKDFFSFLLLHRFYFLFQQTFVLFIFRRNVKSNADDIS